MGRVYKVFDADIKDKIALKLIKPEIASDRETIERFSNELKFARAISQRNVCRMYDLGRADGSLFITMEYVRGEDLKSMIRMAAGLSPGAILSIGKQVCDGLAEAHVLGVVHRDLKPQNIMIDKGGNAKIMDFGIARSLRAKGITGPSVLMGTPEYMSPEQAEAADVDHRSDIYSLGIVLFEMATGRVPFEGETALSIAMKHKGEIPKSPKQFNPGIPEDLAGVILKCLEKNPAKRYQSACDVRAELERIEKGLPTTERVVPETKAPTSREITVTLKLKKAVLPAAGIVAVALAGLFLWRPWSSGKAVSAASSGKPSLAVMYFENNTGDEKLDHWRKGISDLLITDLTQSKYMKVLGGDKLFNILNEMGQAEAGSFSSEVLREVAARGEVDHIARGSYSKAGGILRIDIVLQDARSGEPVATQRVEGKGEESIFAMVDELTKWAKASLKIPAEQAAGDLDKGIRQVTTSSPEAYKFYIEGEKLFLTGQYQRSIECMEKAIALDPGFAMAFRAMAHASANLGEGEEKTGYLRKALAMSDRLSERERLLIQADVYKYDLSSREYGKAIENYQKLITLYPDSEEAAAANHNLAGLFVDIEEWDKAIECYEAAIEAGIQFFGTYRNLHFPYMAKGDYDKAKKVLENFIGRFPGNATGYWELAKLYAFQGQFEPALKEVDKAAAIEPTFTKGRFYHVMGDFAKAEETYKKWLGFVSKNHNLEGRIYLDKLYRGQGRFEEAVKQMQLGIGLAEELGSDAVPYFYYYLALNNLSVGKHEEALKAVRKAEPLEEIIVNLMLDLELEGWICAEMVRPDEARKAAAEIKKLVEAGLYKKRIRHCHFVTGLIQLKAKNYPGAIRSLKDAVALLPFPAGWDYTDGTLYKYFLGLAYLDSGDLAKARDEFEGVVALIPGRLDFSDLYARSFYRLGLIHERQGNTAKAVENLGKFLDLWKDADPGLSEVEDARERLTRLKLAA